MPVTMQQVLAEIEKDEPDYPALARLGPEALPHLQQISQSDDPLKAAKATYAASLIGGAGAVDILKNAGDHHDAQVRIAAATGLQNLAAAAPSELVLKALSDQDPGVRKLALRSASVLNRADLKQRITAIAQGDPEEHLRGLATETANRIR